VIAATRRFRAGGPQSDTPFEGDPGAGAPQSSAQVRVHGARLGAMDAKEQKVDYCEALFYRGGRQSSRRRWRRRATLGSDGRSASCSETGLGAGRGSPRDLEGCS